mgnify:CR=1 FL=1
MVYKIGNTNTTFYAAQDLRTGDYLTAAGWGYGPDDPWQVRNANWHRDLRRLSRSLKHAQRLVDGLETYYRAELDRFKERILQYQRERAQNPTHTHGWFDDTIKYSQDAIDRIHARMPFNIQIIKVSVNTTVDTDPV